MIVVDGLPWPVLERYSPWFEAGLRRVLDEGQVYQECRYLHVPTETAPGHACLGTGAVPRVHGIVANSWFATDSKGRLKSQYSITQPAFAAPGSPPMFYREVERDGRQHVFAFEGRLAAWQETGELEHGVSVSVSGYGDGGEDVVFDSRDARYLYDLRRNRDVGLFAKGRTSGPGNLKVDTLGDRLAATFPQARVVTVSAKDRGAIFLAGRDRSHVAYWYDRETGNMRTSSAYDTETGVGDVAADLVRQFNRANGGDRLLQRMGSHWRKLPAPANVTQLPQAAPAEKLANFQVPVNGLFFDHDLVANASGYYSYPNRFSSDFGDPEVGAKRSGYFIGVYQSPFTDELVADLVLTFVSDGDVGLGQDDVPDLLGISFSAFDPVSHSYGAESEESLDVLRRLDIQVGRVFAALDERVGAGNYVVAFTADHGFSPIPEYQRQLDPSFRGGRLVDSSRTSVNFVERVNRLLATELCLPAGTEPILALDVWSLVYNRPELPFVTVAGPCGEAGRPVGVAQIDAVLPRIITTAFAEEVEAVLLVSQRALWDPAHPATEFFVNGFDAERSGDALLVPRRGVIWGLDSGRGSGHGAPYESDTHVPLVFLGKSFQPGVLDGAATPYDLAPTLAEAMGVTLPDATGTSLLGERAQSR